jgi:hypothetical protein
MFKCSSKTCREPIETPGYCPECKKAYRLKWSAAHPGYFTQKKKEWDERHPEKVAEANKRRLERYHASRPPKVDRVPLTMAERQRRYYEKYPIKFESRKIYKAALKTGRIVKEPCRVCGALEVDGHHEDYFKPLEVVWLCRPHHAEVHKKNRQKAT